MLDLSAPRRQSLKSIVIYIFKNVKGLIALFLYSAFGFSRIEDYRIIIGVIAVFLLIGFISPFLKYYFFTFHVEDDELIIQKGMLNKERKAIPLERIQSVNITQNLIQRILKVVAVEVETAGSKAKELEIPGLDKDFAQAFKNLLQDKIEQDTTISTQSPRDDVDNAVKDSINIEVTDKSYQLLSLDFIDLLKIGITQNHLRSGGLALGVTIGFWYNIKDVVEQFYGDIFDGFEWGNVAGYANLSLAVIALLLFSIASVLVSVVLVINKYYDYTLFRNGNYLEIKMGLLNRREIKIPLQKVQILEFHTNPLRRLLNYHTAKIYQAQSQGTTATSAEVPACSPSMMTLLQQLLFEHIVQEDAQTINSIGISHARLTSYFLLVPLVAIVSVGIYFERYSIAALAILFVGLIIYKAYLDGKHTAITSDHEMIFMRSGWLFHKIIIIPVYKTQAVQKWRSFFLKKRQQIHFTLHTAAGSRNSRYFKENEITDLKNKINNLVLVSRRNWM